MHIAFRTSGGRGEYEVVGTHSGYTAASLEGWTFHMQWPDGKVRDTGLWLDPAESGKPRLRSMLTPQIQIGRIVAAMLMLPDPIRQFGKTLDAEPIAQSKKYVIVHVGFSVDSQFAEMAERVTFVPSFVTIMNKAQSDSIGVAARWERIKAVYDAADQLPAGLRPLVIQHRDFMASGEIVKQQLSTIVKNIQEQLLGTFGLAYEEGTDPLLALEELLSIHVSEDAPTLPPPDELDEDVPEVSVRAAHEYRLAKSRGAAGRTFSRLIRNKYGHRCALCGAKFSGIEGIRSGIEAAHILAWSKHNLDVVQNGIALCKLHHWAFDAGILMPWKDQRGYYIRFTTLASDIDPDSLARLGSDGQRIPAEWLPEDPANRPSDKYLKLLQADLGVTFRDESA